MRSIIHITLLLTFFLIMTNAMAEYRAYQYMVQSKYSDDNAKAYMVTSSLDPVSYVSYHGGSDSISVNLLRTWMCPGNTGNWQTCPAPGDEIADRVPASVPEL